MTALSHEAKLARMANRVADFFRPYPEDEAVAGIREHLAAFWTRRMRLDLTRYVVAAGPGVDPLVARALTGAPVGDGPVDRAAGPDSAGQRVGEAG